MIYLDSCALVKLVATEPETEALTAYVDDRRSELVSSQIALTEVIRVVRRSCFDATRSPSVAPEVFDRRMNDAARLLDRVDLVVLDRRVLVAAAGLDGDPFVRSMDAIHLASARVLGDQLKAFVTYDKRLASAALEIGMPVQAPA